MIDLWEVDLIKGHENWPKEKLGLYAPGFYTCRCRDCNGTFEGDKRSIQGYPCAKISKDEFIESSIGENI